MVKIKRKTNKEVERIKRGNERKKYVERKEKELERRDVKRKL